jgi:NAD(P)-dependent dehydrogenase (short-subunit alcohol dehydrogenase family)
MVSEELIRTVIASDEPEEALARSGSAVFLQTRGDSAMAVWASRDVLYIILIVVDGLVCRASRPCFAWWRGSAQPMTTAQTRQRTVLITGASRRIGRVLALDFARRGWRIGIHFRRSRREAEALAAQLRALGTDAEPLAADLAVTANVNSLVPRCRDALGAPICLINNASEFHVDTATTMTPEGWDVHLNVNLKASVFLAQALSAHLPEGQEGHVINIIDQRAWRPTPEFFSYTVSKAGLWTATRMLAQALAPRVRVNAIGPGPALPNIHQRVEDFEAEKKSTLLQRGTSPEEIAAAVRFILDAPAMTGQMIALDGGQHLAWSNAQRPVLAPVADSKR